MLKAQSDTPTTGTLCHSAMNGLTFEDTLFLTAVLIGPNDDDPIEINKLLELFSFEGILKKARSHKLVNLLRPFTLPSEVDKTLEDIAQEVHFKFWRCLKQKKMISNYEAYIARMIHNEFINETRRSTRHGGRQISLASENEGRIEDTTLVQPVEEVEQGLMVIYRMRQIAAAVAELPSRQRLAMTCFLLDEAQSFPLMKEILQQYSVDTEVAWPQGKKAKQRLQANLSPARKALAKKLNIDIAEYISAKRRSRRSRVSAVK